MTGDAFFVKNRLDLGVEMDRFFAQPYPVGQQKQQKQEADAEKEIPTVLQKRKFHLAIFRRRQQIKLFAVTLACFMLA